MRRAHLRDGAADAAVVASDTSSVGRTVVAAFVSPHNAADRGAKFRPLAAPFGRPHVGTDARPSTGADAAESSSQRNPPVVRVGRGKTRRRAAQTG